MCNHEGPGGWCGLNGDVCDYLAPGLPDDWICPSDTEAIPDDDFDDNEE